MNLYIGNTEPKGNSSYLLKTNLKKFDGDFFGLYPITKENKPVINPYFTQLLEVIYETILDSGENLLDL